MRRFLLGAVATSFVVAAGIDPSVAQTVDSGTSGLQEIIVTAQKRPENINTVPIVISVLTNQDLIQSRVGTTQELEWATPGLVFGNTNGFAQPFIRGIGTDLIGPGQDSPVGFYLDGVYLPWTPSVLQQFGDISRIEVLKGPQGTLYGRNTTGGAINIITRDPEQTFSADASVSGGNDGYGKGTIYASIADKNEIALIDTQALTIRSRWPVAPAGSPTALAIDKEHRRLFSAGRAPQMLVVLDADNGHVIQSFPISAGVDAAAYEAETGLVFASTREGMIHIFHEDSPDKFSEVETVNTEFGAKTMGLDSKTHRLFVDTADFGPPANPTADQPHPRRTAISGTFRVLVYGP